MISCKQNVTNTKQHAHDTIEIVNNFVVSFNRNLKLGKFYYDKNFTRKVDTVTFKGDSVCDTFVTFYNKYLDSVVFFKGKTNQFVAGININSAKMTIDHIHIGQSKNEVDKLLKINVLHSEDIYKLSDDEYINCVYLFFSSDTLYKIYFSNNWSIN